MEATMTPSVFGINPGFAGHYKTAHGTTGQQNDCCILFSREINLGIVDIVIVPVFVQIRCGMIHRIRIVEIVKMIGKINTVVITFDDIIQPCFILGETLIQSEQDNGQQAEYQLFCFPHDLISL
jgi:hypothetical protein